MDPTAAPDGAAQEPERPAGASSLSVGSGPVGAAAPGAGADAVRVVVVEPHALLREGLRHLLDAQPGIDLVGAAGSVEDAVTAVPSSGADVAVVEPVGSGCAPGEAVRRLRDAGCRVLVLSDHDAPATLAAAVTNGADGYLVKTVDPAGLVRAVRDVDAGASVLAPSLAPAVVESLRRGAVTGVAVTGRQLQVLQRVQAGLADRRIAEDLGLSPRTVEKHVEHLLRRFGVRDRRALVAAAVQAGVLHPAQGSPDGA